MFIDLSKLFKYIGLIEVRNYLDILKHNNLVDHIVLIH